MMEIYNNMKKIYVCGKDINDVIEIIEIDVIPDFVEWNDKIYSIRNTKCASKDHYPMSENLNKIGGKSYFFISDEE